MSAEMWRENDSNFFIVIDAEHKNELRNIKQSKSHWQFMWHYEKNGKILSYQFRFDESDYRKGKRIVDRINGHKTE